MLLFLTKQIFNIICAKDNFPYKTDIQYYLPHCRCSRWMHGRGFMRITDTRTRTQCM